MTKPKKDPKKTGRPAEGVPLEASEKLLDWLESGKTLTSYLALEDTPSASSTITEWKKKDPQFAERFARAREAGAAMMVDEGQDILDKAKPDTISVAKEQAAYRLKRAACFCPSVFGSKVALGGDPSAPPIKVDQSPGPTPPQSAAEIRTWAAKLAAMAGDAPTSSD